MVLVSHNGGHDDRWNMKMYVIFVLLLKVTLLRKHCNVKSFPSICLMFIHCTLCGKCPNQRECFGKDEMLS